MKKQDPEKINWKKKVNFSRLSERVSLNPKLIKSKTYPKGLIDEMAKKMSCLRLAE